MAVPKKRLSKSKTRTRVSKWKGKGRKSAEDAFSRARSVLKEESSFVFDLKKLKLDKKKGPKEENDDDQTKEEAKPLNT